MKGYNLRGQTSSAPDPLWPAQAARRIVFDVSSSRLLVLSSSRRLMLYLWTKVFHIVFMVSWMAGLFYLPRLFVYHAESLSADEPKRSILGAQFQHMEQRLFSIIMQPAMLLTWATGVSMVALIPTYLREPWFWLKFLLVALLTVYHFVCRQTIARFAASTVTRSGEWYRVFNEAPTVVLVLAAALVLFKGLIRVSALATLLICTLLVIVVGFRAYAAFRRTRGEMVESTSVTR